MYVVRLGWWSIILLLSSAAVGTITAELEIPHEGAYTESFFQQHLKQSKAYPALVGVMSGVITELLGMNIHPHTTSVLDVGCGHGLLVEAWRNSAGGGFVNSYGVEGSDAAVSMWPTQYKDKYYRLVNLESVASSREQITSTDFVTTFEVAEHIQPDRAEHFVELLTLYQPKLIFFGAATPMQDRGMNPSHVNEQPFRYWLHYFTNNGYHVDWSSSALARMKLLSLQDPSEQQAMIQAWWYPKNLLIFAPNVDRLRSHEALLKIPDSMNMLDPTLLQMAYSGGDAEFGSLWERDMRDFGRMFHQAQKMARDGMKEL